MSCAAKLAVGSLPLFLWEMSRFARFWDSVHASAITDAGERLRSPAGDGIGDAVAAADACWLCFALWASLRSCKYFGGDDENFGFGLGPGSAERASGLDRGPTAGRAVVGVLGLLVNPRVDD